MRRNLIILAIALLSFTSFTAFSTSNDPIADLLKKLEEFTAKYTQEKVYLHLDKPYYAVGDDIWFKGYIVDAKSAAPSLISSILYVELINDKDSIINQIKRPIENGITWGDFKLVDTLKEGNYRIRAYTQWMRNSSPDFFFDKTLKVGNSWSNEVFTKISTLLSTDGTNDKVSSTIQFNHKEGKPYANTEVSYEVQVNNKNIARGRLTTNASGEITIGFNNSSISTKTGKIIATLTVDKKKITKTIPIKTTSSQTDVQFFPEGGTLVEGLPGRIGIKAVNANGLGEDISGSIIDNTGAEILKFETSYLGMGSIFLSPEAGKTYTAKVKFANGSEKTLALPKIEKSGYALSINNSDSAKVAIKVMLSANLLNTGDLQLLTHHNGGVYFVSKIPTTKQFATITLSKKDMLSGIVQFTLFNSANIPVNERIIFVNNSSDKIDLALQNLNPSYTKREKVDLNFNAFNNSEPVQGSFSIAVTNASSVTPDLANESNILTRLLLTSDLMGYIEKPNAYFLNNNSKTSADLNHLLLTQGWRKINWQQVASTQQAPLSFAAEKTMKISGKITKGGKPVAGGKVSLFSSSGGLFAVDTLSNEKGEFNFDQIIFTDSAKFVVQARTDKNNKNVQIDLDVVPRQIVTTNKNTGDIEVNVNESLMNYLKESDLYFNEQHKKGLLSKTITLKEVNVVGTRTQAPNSSNLNGPGSADAIITAKDLQNNIPLSQFLMGRVAGIITSNGKAYARGSKTPMAIVVDGFVNRGDEFLLDDIVVQDIESVEVLKTIAYTSIYGSNGGSGVLVITTKRGGGSDADSYYRYAPGIVTYNPKGYYHAREFYSPKYDVNSDAQPDLRSTVYWNPHVVSDATGKGNFSFYNTDAPGTYRVVIEGIDGLGNLARKVYTYEVK
jgi:TonB-dependent SusC/RagA subfamily outer membrane receptor